MRRLECFAINERVVNQGTGELKTFWTRIGAAFENKDGSITLRLDALPINNTIMVRESKEKDGSHG